jgi:hypothetical protein
MQKISSTGADECLNCSLKNHSGATASRSADIYAGRKAVEDKEGVGSRKAATDPQIGGGPSNEYSRAVKTRIAGCQKPNQRRNCPLKYSSQGGAALTAKNLSITGEY